MIEGTASLDCLAQADGPMDCTVTSEHPAGFGFGEAAVNVSREFRMRAQTNNGEPTVGGRYRLRISFRYAED
jgi:periplasmic protein TonB